MVNVTIVSKSRHLTDRLSGCFDGGYDLRCVNDLTQQVETSCLLLLDHDQLHNNQPEDLAGLIRSHEDNGIPVLLVWADSEEDHRELAMELGCSDYLRGPFYASVVNSKCKTYASLAKLKQGFNSDELDQALAPLSDNQECAEDKELLAVQNAAILCLATIARVRDHSTGNHILRTQHYVKALAEHLRKHPDYMDQLDDETIDLFYKTSALHDIGKVGIPDSILQKPGELTSKEYEVMKSHTILGYQAFNSALQLMGHGPHNKALRFLEFAQQVTLSHHERWDGDGYPQGLSGEDIPLIARLMAVADVYDAMISRRPYKSALDHQKVKDVIISGRGTHFDPAVVDAFLDLQDMFERISYKLEDVFPSSADMMLHSISDLIAENDLSVAGD